MDKKLETTIGKKKRIIHKHNNKEKTRYCFTPDSELLLYR